MKDVEEIKELVDEIIAKGDQVADPLLDILKDIDQSGLVGKAATLITNIFLVMSPFGEMLNKAATKINNWSTDRSISTYNRLAAARVPEPVIVEIMNGGVYRSMYLTARFEAAIKEGLSNHRDKKVQRTSSSVSRLAQVLAQRGLTGN